MLQGKFVFATILQSLILPTLSSESNICGNSSQIAQIYTGDFHENSCEILQNDTNSRYGNETGDILAWVVQTRNSFFAIFLYIFLIVFKYPGGKSVLTLTNGTLAYFASGSMLFLSIFYLTSAEELTTTTSGS